MCLVLTWWLLLQDMLDDLAPALNSSAVENNVSAAEVDSHRLTEKGQSIQQLLNIQTFTSSCLDNQ